MWKDIKGYEGIYQVNEYGEVKSLERTVHGRHFEEQIMKQHTIRGGYICVWLRKKDTHKCALVHRLVAEAFIPNPNNYREINHIDENKNNNTVSNLEWCDRKHNMYSYYSVRPERCCKVGKYDLDGNLLKEYPSICQASKDVGASISSIRSCLAGKCHTVKGYAWKRLSA